MALLVVEYINMHFFGRDKKAQYTPKEICKYIEKMEKRVQDLEKRAGWLEQAKRGKLGRVGVVRFNSVGEVGGRQSFSVALLDEGKSGVIITSHYLREFNRVYAKPVVAGESKYELTAEEKEALQRASA